MIGLIAIAALVFSVLVVIFMRQKTKKEVEKALWTSKQEKIRIIRIADFRTRMADLKNDLSRLDSAVSKRKEVMSGLKETKKGK